jgi:hypothetical protein
MAAIAATTARTTETRRPLTAAGRTATRGDVVHDLTIELEDRPGALAELGEALGAAGTSVEGGGVFVTGGRAVAHFLFRDGEAARAVLSAAGIRVVACREVLIRRLDQERPGQLGAITRALADAGVNIEAQYSDHDHRLILVVDDPRTAAAVTVSWAGPPQASDHEAAT